MNIVWYDTISKFVTLQSLGFQPFVISDEVIFQQCLANVSPTQNTTVQVGSPTMLAIGEGWWKENYSFCIENKPLNSHHDTTEKPIFYVESN